MIDLAEPGEGGGEKLPRPTTDLGYYLSPKDHPAMGKILWSFEPEWLGDATGRGTEPSTQRSVPSCCMSDAVSLARPWRQVADPAVRTNGVVIILPFGKQLASMLE